MRQQSLYKHTTDNCVRTEINAYEKNIMQKILNMVSSKLQNPKFKEVIALERLQEMTETIKGTEQKAHNK